MTRRRLRRLGGERARRSAAASRGCVDPLVPLQSAVLEVQGRGWRSSAMSGSWVTTTSVMPSSRFSRWKMAMISRPIRESSAPVGSSARMMRGSLTSDRAMATRCCCPPESWLGWCSSRPARPDRAQRLQRARSRRSRADVIGVEQRQLDVLGGAGARQQVELLEDEPDLAGFGSPPARRCRARRR